MGVAAGFQLTHEPMDPFREELIVLPVRPLRYAEFEPGTVSAFRMKRVRRPRKTSVWIVGDGSRFKSETPENKSEILLLVPACSYTRVQNWQRYE
jgi:hypothetical protein